MRKYAFLIALAGAAFAIYMVAGASANLSGSTFEGNDGNLVSNGGKDWASNAPNLAVGVDLPTGTGDNSFGQGAKENDVNTTVVSGSIPNSKADLARFAVAGETIGSKQFLYLAWSRENQSGTVNFDFEINAAAQPDLTTPGAKTLNRTVNDLLINYAFQGGSNTPTLTKFTWNGNDWGTGSVISSACSEGATNAAQVSENLGGNPAVNRPAQQFGEAAIDVVCAGIVPPNACESFNSAYVKSRSSTSFNSEIKDFIAPVPLSFSNCGKLTIIKHTVPADLDQNFSYTTTGGADISDFTLNDKTGDTKVFNNMHPGTYTVTEGADPSGFAFDSLTCSTGGAVNGKVATVTMTAGADITCTYINKQQLGAIKVSKASTKAGVVLAGAKFSVTGPGGFSQELTTGADGTACVDGLTFGNYDVKETAAPAGYKINDTTTHTVNVNVNTTCAGSPQSLSFVDTPLTDILAKADSQAVGGTKSQITCKQGTTTIGSSQNVEHAQVEVKDLEPGTYVCTIVVDP